MRIFSHFLFLSFLLAVSTSLALANPITQNYWVFLPEGPTIQGDNYIQARQKRLYQMNHNSMKQYLLGSPLEANVDPMNSSYLLHLPNPEGSFDIFKIVESSIMEAPLQEQFPNIRTYLGQGITDPRANIRLDITPAGFHAMVMTWDKTWFIDPYLHGNPDFYIVYNKADFIKHHSKQFIESEPEAGQFPMDSLLNEAAQKIATPNGSTRRTYRLAVATSRQYTNFHGGTVSAGLAAVVTTVNRVSGLYEREFAIRFILVASNNLLIFTDVNDPWTDQNSTQTTIAQASTVINGQIGSTAYDIGHVFNTGAGGLASLQSVCGVNKARGVSGIGAPIGDPFDVDYVCHEIGHQFGARHTFNASSGSCLTNISSTNAYEPGSGTTIMAYAGLCAPQNIQSNTEDYFHVANYLEVLAFVNSGGGGSCAQTNATGNTPPTATPFGGTFTIPKNTPFSITGFGFDANNDPLTYNWEQFDLGPQGPPTSPTGNAPVFRSVRPDTIPTRYFPPLSFLKQGTNAVVPSGEALVNYGRNTTFRLTVRDNRAGGGGRNNTSPFTVIVSDLGPINVTAPTSTIGTFLGWNSAVGQSRTVTWTVNNTTQSPLNIANVRIEFSADDGLTWPYILAANTPNDGTESIIVPNVSTQFGRLRIISVTPNIWYAWARTRIVLTAVNGINDISLTDAAVEVYPNPAQDRVSLLLDDNWNSSSLSIHLVDIAGRKIKTWENPQSMINNELEFSLPMFIQNGMYYIQVEDSQHRITKKLSIIR